MSTADAAQTSAGKAKNKGKAQGGSSYGAAEPDFGAVSPERQALTGGGGTTKETTGSGPGGLLPS